MNVLVLDTGFSDGLVAAQGNDGRRAQRLIGPFGTHGETILAAIQEVLDELGLDRRDLERVGVGQGPGSFTGLRIALATAQGLASSLGVELVGYPTFEALPQPRTHDLVHVFDARRGQLFAARMDNNILARAACHEPETVGSWIGANTLVFGDGPVRYPQLLASGGTWLEGPYTVSADRALKLTLVGEVRAGPLLPTYRRGAEAQVLFGSPELDRALDGDEIAD
ncbi:MAG: tRNA (adenosine(37)-N6)-threonylcarbamoyltransferase complex dimerization subunit type 1 TsaB [Myxococcales bacterium]|nr:tRNA (adenosine(37)-N6)-threonylcarbamoyltransferase complex dimerization subunit type 1 TsaB [Myxococcales bacterium]